MEKNKLILLVLIKIKVLIVIRTQNIKNSTLNLVDFEDSR